VCILEDERGKWRNPVAASAPPPVELFCISLSGVFLSLDQRVSPGRIWRVASEIGRILCTQRKARPQVFQQQNADLDLTLKSYLVLLLSMVGGSEIVPNLITRSDGVTRHVEVAMTVLRWVCKHSEPKAWPYILVNSVLNLIPP